MGPGTPTGRGGSDVYLQRPARSPPSYSLSARLLVVQAIQLVLLSSPCNPFIELLERLFAVFFCN